jgi:hypothetical protein
MARSRASIKIWISMNLSRARSALSRSNGAARAFCESVAILDHALACLFQRLNSFAHVGFPFHCSRR